MAQKTDAARNKGGSPTALLEYTALGLDAPLNIQPNDKYLQHCISTTLSLRLNNLSLSSPEQADVELGRDVVEAWDLVSAWTSG